MDKNFTKDCTELYKQLWEMGDRARKVITAFVKSHGGEYTIDIDEGDHAWVGDEVYATALKTDRNGNVLVFNSGNYSEYLNGMANENILDLALHLNNIED